MRLQLIIQRHGLPITRILWTTSSRASGPGAPYGGPAPSSSTIASTRFPNATYGNGGYTIAQLLEDVNEVVPLETEGKSGGENDEFGGQWGLEDYAVEVGGFECLHFMEVEGLLRDGDEVVIRALHTADLRARRISGRLQISADGRHLIDGVPFGRQYLKRSFSSRPAIRIPPRKRRRTSFSSWDEGLLVDDEDWPAHNPNAGKELVMFDDVSDQGTVIRHPTDDFDDSQGSDSDADTSELDDEDLNEELKGLRDDLEAEGLEAAGLESPRVTRTSGRVSRLTHRAPQAAVDASPTHRSSASASHRSDSAETSQKSSKNVRFHQVSEGEDSSSASDVSSDEDSSSEGSEEAESADSSDEDSSSDTSDTSSISDSESEPEMTPAATEKPQHRFTPPGQGSVKTKKSNHRNKLRRKLAKLKELGHLAPDANFQDLRAWEAENGGGPLTEVTDLGESRSSQGREQSEFEARRQQLLRQLESGGIDVDGHSEKENIPPQYRNGSPSQKESAEDVGNEPVVESAADVADATVEEAPESAKRRKLDVASSRRLLFGSLGVRTPKSKADEEAARHKLAGPTQPQSFPRKDVDQDADAGAESDMDENWQEKLVVSATECVFEDINLNTPSFPFKQRWDDEAGEQIRHRRNNGNRRKNRKRKSRDWQEEEEQYEYDGVDEGYSNGDIQLHYDEPSGLQANGASEDVTGNQAQPSDDLPLLPDDLTSVPDLVADRVQQGAIIAFKQLDMSKATHWQPKVSEYRVAEVESVAEDSTISLRLAKRDREQRKATDDEDGGREYSGFEMPGLDDEVSEDDGFRQVSFGELIEPKLLQAAERGSAQVEVNGKEASLSDREGASEDASKAASAGDNCEASAEATGPSADVELPVISTQTRNEISQIIHDAGFRSALDSELQEPDLLSAVMQAVCQPQEQGSGPSPVVRSPTFTGFSSSPPEVGSSRVNVDDESHFSLPRSPTPSPPNDAEVVQDDPVASPTSYQIPRSSHSPGPAEDQPTLDYPQLPNMSDQPEDRVRNIPRQMDGTAEIPDDDEHEGSSSNESDASAAEEHDTLHDIAGREIHSSRSNASWIPNPFYEKDRAQEERLGQIGESQASETLDDTLVESSFELPSLETLFRSTAPARSARKLGSPAPRGKRNALSSPRQRSPSVASLDSASESPSPSADEEDNSSSPPLTTPQVIVDLTISSPAESPEGSDEDFAKSRRLPKGPGWVQKNVPASRRRTRSSAGSNGLDLGSSTSPSQLRRAGSRKSRQTRQNHLDG